MPIKLTFTRKRICPRTGVQYTEEMFFDGDKFPKTWTEITLESSRPKRENDAEGLY